MKSSINIKLIILKPEIEQYFMYKSDWLSKNLNTSDAIIEFIDNVYSS